MTIFEFVVLAMATWRISVMLSKETGPFHIFEKIRELTGIKHDIDGNVLHIPQKMFAELLSCVWCDSVWVGTFWVLLWLFFPQISLFIALPFALSTLAILVDRLA